MKSTKMIKNILSLVVVAIIAVFAFVILFERIENGYVGVRYSINGGVRDETLGQGIKFVGLDKVTQYPIRLQTIQAENMAIATSDGKKTSVNIKYDYKIDPTKTSAMFKEFGNITSQDIEDGWLKSKLQKEAREVYSQYTILDILSGKSSEAEAKLLDSYSKAVEVKGFVVEDVTVGVPDIDAETQKSIDAIVLSGQENEKAKLDAETKKTQADAKAYETTKQAEAEATANKKIADSVTENLIKYEEAQARKEHGWVTVNGASAVVKEGE
ncbi:SPFH domain-containing protein [Vagococcus zengguangii]|uniref:Prohibitin family protein n=1 Tax=Vagococcus zengguangii TaxID=2571750 RepID=A0A4D7CUA7_9ENTE|nr:SPFH domain-containing protein [Vagococcus zengguangii]QCI86602.1 prohibitin family protein [Vagococcus zengguangii]TLG79762.1 prohibitin family protein [Vagococcus zengguangii]